MPSLNLPPIESLDVEDLLTLPEGYRYELHEGNLVIMTPSTFWHKDVAGRIYLLLHAAGLRIFQDPGVLGDRPGSAYSLVVEIVSENSLNGEYTDKMDWYAKRGIPEYWIVDQAPDRDEDDAYVRILRLLPEKSAYVWERSLLLSELEAEYRAG